MIRAALMCISASRKPDFVIGGEEAPYLLRWWVIPRNKFFNIYLHQFLRSDDDRALHDHPWMNASWILENQYTEHTIAAGGIQIKTLRKVGQWAFRFTGRIAHRIELTHGPCWTLFITGPRYRSWGFHCPQAGWVHWKKFTDTHDQGATGKGCE